MTQFKKLFFALPLAFSALFLAVNSIFAIDVPNFPQCPNTEGTVIASYPDGVHGVPGDSSTYSGNDSVHQINEATLTQCLCTTENQGIQTNWWKVSSLDEEQISELTNSGWILIPNGADWGLQEGPYLAMNSPYNCAPTPIADPDLCANIDGIQTSVPGGLHIDASGRNCVAFQLGGAPTPPPANGSVLGASTTGGQVLGAHTSVLAATGDLYQARLVLAGLVFTLSSLYLVSKFVIVSDEK